MQAHLLLAKKQNMQCFNQCMAVILCRILWCLAGIHMSHSFSSSISSSSFINPLPTQKNSQVNNGSLMNMKTRIAIVGLPNVGKSQLFNAVAQKSIAESANYPFCTIEPNITPIPVPDKYLEKLSILAKSTRHVPATMELVDVAGLVEGASRGEGLGNRFLATVRECDVICHLLRCYEDPDVIHVNGKVDPVADAEVVNLELLLADLAHVTRRLERTSCKGEERTVLEKIEECLQRGIPARAIGLSAVEKFVIKSMGLLTLKPVLYTFNVDEVDFMFDREALFARLKESMNNLQYSDPETQQYAMVSAKFEAEFTSKTRLEQGDYLSSLGVELESDDETMNDLLSYKVLPNIVRTLLGLSLVYTGPGVPPERSRTTKAYLFSSDDTLNPVNLAGKIHAEIEKGFICAEITQANKLLDHPSYVAAKESGSIRTEGKKYIIQSNDVVFIKWNQ